MKISDNQHHAEAALVFKRPTKASTATLAVRGARDLTYAELPQQLADGTDTYVFGFRLDDAGAGSDWSAPLVLRIFRSIDDATRAERETSVQRFASERGYRTPQISWWPLIPG